jgi:uncharacterized protein
MGGSLRGAPSSTIAARPVVRRQLRPAFDRLEPMPSARSATYSLLLAATLGCGPVGEPVPLVVVTWNVANLFNDRRDSPELLSEAVHDSAGYQGRVLAIRDVLREIRADVIALQEVENAFVTLDLAQALSDFSYTSTSQGNDPRGIDNALLSRWPLTEVRAHTDEVFFDGFESAGFARDCHEVHLDVAGRELVLLVVHFKATESSSSIARREAEAIQTAGIAASVPGPLIVLGDFNAEPDAPELAALADHVSLGAMLPPAERWSHESGRLLDDQRPNTALLGAYQSGSLSIARSSKVAEVSDHAPVSATYLLEP